jgi:palmitoyltransferase
MDRDEEGITPLHWAAINDRIQTCAYLIEQGTDVNKFGGSIPATPLQCAARKGLVKIIDLLIQHGADPRLVHPQDISCLHSVTRSSDFSAVLYILCQPDIVIDERDHMGLTPLHTAAQQGDEALTQVLLKFGADPNAVDHGDFTALHWAASGGHGSCISLLLEAGADIRAKNKDQHTAQELADMYRNRAEWDMVVNELGFKSDGMRIRRPLSEVCVL